MIANCKDMLSNIPPVSNLLTMGSRAVVDSWQPVLMTNFLR